MTSAELARVKEITCIRMFEAQNDNDDEPVIVAYNVRQDSLYCFGCTTRDNCFHTGRARLSGVLTHSVVKHVRDWRNYTDKNTANDAVRET
jgi:hypothetical protein